MVNILHESVKLGEHFYCYIWHGRGNNCNTILWPSVLRGQRPHVIIDPGHVRNELGEPCSDSLARAIERDGFRLTDVGLVIATHSHPDHVEAAELLVGKNGALYALSREEHEFYGTTGKAFFQTFGARALSVHPFFFLKEGQLTLGTKDSKIEVKVLLTPGHSPGSLCFYLEQGRILVSGDVVFAGSIGRTDFPGGSLSLLRKSIDRLAELEVEYLVPGHSTEMGSVIAGRDRVKRNFYTVKMFI